MSCKFWSIFHSRDFLFDLKVVSKITVTLDEQLLWQLEESRRAQDFGARPLTQSSAWEFHGKHGEDVELSKNQQSAEYTRTGYVDGDAIYPLVFSSMPMADNRLYEVKVDATSDNTSGWSLCCGVTDGHPDNLTLPTGNVLGWRRAVSIVGGAVWVYGSRMEKNTGDSLTGLRAGSRVGLLVDPGNNLHLFVDGQHRGVVVTHIRRPSFAMFEVYCKYSKISTTTLTVRTVT